MRLGILIGLGLVTLCPPSSAAPAPRAPSLPGAGQGPDCNGNGVPDDEDIATGTSQDCNGNAIPDECDIADGTSLDCNANGVPDECDIADGTSLDCNVNGVPDECDIADGTSLDCNANEVPDECEPDCNENGIPDECDLASGTSLDCNANDVPDECDIADGTSSDCNVNAVPDECDLASGTSLDCNANAVPDECELDCNANGVPDDCDLGAGTSLDCNGNGVPDECDLDGGGSPDCDANGVPDECDLASGTHADCNGNGVPDVCDLTSGLSSDCNGNGVPDECDLAAGTSEDCDENGVPDECDPDCNDNGQPDPCDLAGGTSLDCNENGVPDECDIAMGTSEDANGNGIPDECEPEYNVVVFFIDDVGPDQMRLYDALNPYDGTSDPFLEPLYAHTPFLDQLAAEGVTFMNAYSAPVCSPARAALLTGCYAARHGIGTAVREDHVGGLAEFGDPGFELPTLADLAHGVGYQASVVGKWHLGLPTTDMDPVFGNDDWLGWEHIPLRGGWDDYRCTFRNLNTTPYPNSSTRGYYSFYWNDNGTVAAREGEYATSVQIDSALDYCNNAPGPFVSVVSPNACHSPWHQLPPAELVNTPYYLEQSPEQTTIFKGFCATLEALDTEIGRFLAQLDPDVRANTLIIVMGDNGTDEPVMESARDDEGFDLGPTYDFLIDDSSSGGRFKRSTYERGMRVPLIVSGPMVTSPGRTSQALVDVVDLYATIAELIQAEAGDIDGISFLPVIEDPGVGLAEHARQSTSGTIFTDNGQEEEADGLRRAGFSMRIADGRRFKLHREFDFAEGTIEDELYLLQDAQGFDIDPFELSPLPILPGRAYFDVYAQLAQGLAPGIEENFCISEPNSTGMAAMIHAVGSASISANDLLLVAEFCPPNQPGIFYYGSTEIQVPFGNGFRCVGGGGSGVVRLPVSFANATGTLSAPLDHDSLPPTLPIAPGSTWKFQAWFRDPPAGGAQFDLSDGLSIRFVP